MGECGVDQVAVGELGASAEKKKPLKLPHDDTTALLFPGKTPAR